MNSLRSIRVFARPKRWALLVLVAIAWTQLSVAAHQFDHDAHAGAEACTVCIQLERLDDATLQSDAAQLTSTIPAAVPLLPQTANPSRSFRHYASRAPPKS